MQSQFYSLLYQGFTLPYSPTDHDTPLPIAVQKALDRVCDHILTSVDVQNYVASIEKGPGTVCPDSPIQEIIRYLGYQKGQIDKSDAVVNVAFLERHVLPVFRLEREAVQTACMRTDDITPSEQVLLTESMNLAVLHDALWLAWFKRMAVDYQNLDEAGKKHYKETVLPQLDPAPMYDYSVFDVEDGAVCNRQTWAVAFPEIVRDIAEQCATLSNSHFIPSELHEYFAALGRAYACTDVQELDTLWTAVDTTWVKIPQTSRFVPTHAMECGYEHPRCVSPEFRLEIRTEEYQEDIVTCKEATLAHARELGLPETLIAEMQDRYSRLDMYAFVSAIRSGVAVNFRYAGQQVPNRKDVADIGMRIFLDTSNLVRMTDVYAKEIAKHCELGTVALLQPLVTPRAMQLHTITHELAHPVGRTKESDEALKTVLMECLEEAKASLLGVLTEDWRANDPEARIEMLSVTVARLCRFLHKSLYENPTARPYVRENIAAFRTLHDAGVLHITEHGGFYVNEDRAREQYWADELRTLNCAIIAAYQAHDEAGLEALTATYCDTEFPPLQQAIAWVNRSLS